MIRVKIEDTSNGPANIVEKIVLMHAVPRLGEVVAWSEDEGGFTVRTIIWVVDDKDDAEFDVIVRGRTFP